MNGSIKFILFCILFVLGITCTENCYLQCLNSEKQGSELTFCANNELEQTFFTAEISDIALYKQPFYGESGESSAYDVYNAILTQGNSLNGANGDKILKSNSTIHSMRTTSSWIAQEKNKRSGSDHNSNQHTCRYYIYTLRHIII